MATQSDIRVEGRGKITAFHDSYLAVLLFSPLCFALGQGERAVPFPRSREQPRPPFWVTGSAVRGTCFSEDLWKRRVPGVWEQKRA